MKLENRLHVGLLILLVSSVVFFIGYALRNAYAYGQWRERANDLTAQIDSTNAYWFPKYTADSTEWLAQLAALDTVNAELVADSITLAQQVAALDVTRAAAMEREEELRTELDTITVTPRVRLVLTTSRLALVQTDSAFQLCRGQLDVSRLRHTGCATTLTIEVQRTTALERLRTRLRMERDSAYALLKPPSLFKLTFAVGAGASCVWGTSNGSVVCGPSVHLTLLRFKVPLPWGN